MFRSAFRPFSSLQGTRSPRTARCFHKVTTDFVTHDARGNLVTRKVPIIIGDPEETYVLIEKGVGSALCAASPSTLASTASAEDRCKLTFFHDSLHFGFGSSSYPRLYIPNQIPRQAESNTSPATLFMGGKMHHLVLDGTPDVTNTSIPVLRVLIYNAYLAIFAEHANETGRNLESVLDQLKDM
ncbi:hypothetical protein N7453_006818 [Penicillium expansum]|nr:hypothetical protein N7453_006818 [Penicillium expansum]